MKIWLTLDCCYEYLVNGVPGCAVWVSEPFKDDLGKWTSDEVEYGSRRLGKQILSHPEIARLDAEVMLHFSPTMDMALERGKRFSIICQSMRSGELVGDTTFKTTLEVTPEDWFNWALKIGEQYVYEAQHTQRVFDPSIPF